MSTTAPTWHDSQQGDILELVAKGSATGTADAEWAVYVEALRTCAVIGGGLIDPNELRPRVRGLIAPRRISAFSSRARARELVRDTKTFVESDDIEGGNRGKPCRVLEALGGLWASDATEVQP